LEDVSSALFTGSIGSSYDFYCRLGDHVGHWMNYNPLVQASTTVSQAGAILYVPIVRRR
jgi:hypothetical protein